MKYNHALDIAFEVISEDSQGKDITAQMIRKALRTWIENISDKELKETALPPFNSYEMQEGEGE